MKWSTMARAGVLVLSSGLCVAGCTEQDTTTGEDPVSTTTTTTETTTEVAEQPETAGKTANDAASETAASKGAATSKQPAAKPAAKKVPAQVTKLVIEDIKKGTGATAKAGDTVAVHYRGTLTSGEQFDASYDRGQPFTFSLGAGQVIKGWDQGVAGMKEGGKRKLLIPPALGYGPQGTPGGPIPPNATLVFEVELLKVN